MLPKKPTGTTYIKKRQASQWEDLMKKYSEKNKIRCKVTETPVEIAKPQHTTTTFPTGSKYEGDFDIIGMNGYGEYTFPNGVVYKGEFLDGMFHGNGDLVYKDGTEAGSIMRGYWEKGFMRKRTVLFNGILEYHERDWKYCKQPDRRFAVEYEKDLQPAGKSLITPDDPPRDIPPGFYDTGDGFYHPQAKVVYNYENVLDVNRAPSHRERNWIVENCRTEPVGFMGPRPDLYEKWLSPTLLQTPVPDPIVGFKLATDQSDFDQENANDVDEPVFYDCTKTEFKRSESL